MRSALWGPTSAPRVGAEKAFHVPQPPALDPVASPSPAMTVFTHS